MISLKLLKTGIPVALLLTLAASWALTANATREDAITYEIAFSLDEASFQKISGYDTVDIPNRLLTRTAGQAQLPYRVLHFALPAGKSADSIEIVSDAKETIPGEFNLLPAPPSVHWSEAVSSENDETTAKKLLYRRDRKARGDLPMRNSALSAFSAVSYFSGIENDISESTLRFFASHRMTEQAASAPVVIAAQGSLSGLDVVTIHIFPFEYLAAQKQLIFHSQLSFRIILKDRAAPGRAARNVAPNPMIRDWQQKVVANPEAIAALPLAEAEQKRYSSTEGSTEVLTVTEGITDTIDYLIITSAAFETSGAFQPLIDSKTARGLSVMIESVENIEATVAGRDTAEKVRNFIQDKYTNNGLVWVLLGGDTQLVPARAAEPGGEEFTVVADLYFSDLDGDWDADGDSIFGEPEDNVDLYPDVFVGRTPANEESEVQTFVNKVLTYETNAANYAKTALFFGAEDYYDAGGVAKDFIEANYLPDDFTVTKYYERDVPCYRDRAIAALDAGYHFVNHIDHGDQLALRTGCDGISIPDVDALTNAPAFSILWSVGCGVASIDVDTIAEHWMTNPNGGGVAVIGNSRYGNQPESDQYLDPEFYKSLFVEGFTHIGQTLADSKITFIGDTYTNPAMRHDVLGLNMLGDPEMNIDTGN